MLRVRGLSEIFMSNQIVKHQLYRCIVDGRDEFKGEALPIGTLDEVLAWIEGRYRIVGEMTVNKRELDDYVVRIYSQGPRLWSWFQWPVPGIRRYLVEAEGDEWMFVLRPVPDGLLCWHPTRC